MPPTRPAAAVETETFKIGGSTPAAHNSAGDLLLRVVGAEPVGPFRIPWDRVAVLGRGGKADIELNDASISRRHALIYNKEPAPQIVDMHSANGTWVGDRRLEPERGATIAPGDVIRLGSVRLLVTEALEEAEPASHPVASPARVIVVSPQMRELYELAGRIAQSSISVLILGETGSGKEVLAEAIHRRSPRAKGPFLCLNCGALPENLLESELFGHERGAFTGAVQNKVGLLESANGGTVFLDEVGEMPASLQVKLLRVLEERKITRIGDRQPRSIDVRFIAATHRDLGEAVGRGTFRQDLFFRINGITLSIPPLRERVAEIAELARHFLEDAGRRAGFPSAPELSADAVALLEAHDWPGNIRELRNVIERALILCSGGVVTAQNLQLSSPLRTTAVLPTVLPPAPYPPPPPSYAGMPGMPPPSYPGMPPPSYPGMPGPPPSYGAIPPPPPSYAAIPPPPPSYATPPPPSYATPSPPSYGSAPSPAPFYPAASSPGSEEERRRILEALERCAGNQTHAARMLGISRGTLIARLDLYDIPRPRRGRGEMK